ncbi:riboflavin synthase [Desulfovibrio litoralis]|uniref:Riboflavin synthase n=1 Tax=Desulfovibrio litoralis DSM 11393 TaxID=1121455 RepID=A0A1M7SD25_9BACT|nr:riboflavin synthase [Desulfovibrio litoralis]SHN56375.1 riboflavin synthase alpha chain [Desulfovibrio litoralis DSM 11393]
MFTGIIQGQARISGLDKMANECRICFTPLFELKNFQKGESIAANGVCLTVESFTTDSYTVFVSNETLKCTNLNNWKIGTKVNTERALALGDRLGGHLVSGHVDCLAEVSEINKVGLAIIYKILIPNEYTSEIISKGSVALDGISLTVNECETDFFTVSIIPETQNITNISTWKKGYKVNLETDLLGKYVKRMLTHYLKPKTQTEKQAEKTQLSLEFLRENGF